MNATPKDDCRRLYSDLCWLWPIISPPEEYIEEANAIAALIQSSVAHKPVSMLHLGCGGGHFDNTLKKHFIVTGVDTSPAMLSLARTLNPSLRYIEGDMRTARLDERFDVVLIADSIDYMATQDDLSLAFRTAWDHLNDGGVFYTMAEHLEERFVQNDTHSHTRKKGEYEVTTIEHYYRSGPKSIDLMMIYLIRDSSEQRLATDHHRLGLFSADVWRRLLRETGFTLSEVEGSDGILRFICKKSFNSEFSLQ